MNLLSRILFFLVSLTFITGCVDLEKSEKLTDEEKKIMEDLAKTAEDLPAPSRIPQTLNDIGAEYYDDIINDLNKLESYLSDRDKAALNLGVYISDITYLINYDKIEDTEEHMDACHDIGEMLEVHTVFNEELKRRYESNLDDHQALNTLMDEIFKGAAVESSEDLTMSGLVLTGSFIEGLYMTIKVLEDYPEEEITHEERDRILEPLVLLLIDQREPLLDVVQLLRDLPNDESIAWVLNELAILEELFKVDLADVQAKMEAKPEGFVISQDMLIDIIREVVRVRNRIIA